MATESNHTPFDDVKMFMDLAGDITDFEGLLSVPTQADIDALDPCLVGQAERYATLVEEEIEEMVEAQTREDLLDGIIDSIVCLIGLGVTLGFPMQQAWDEVMRSNMTKICPKTGKVIRREDGKILKPAGYSPPDLKKILNVHYAEKKHLQAV